MGIRTLQISIPKPCTVSWQNMQATAGGAFCTSCQKEVIDFTNKSEAEIVEFLSKVHGPVCGKVSKHHINRQLVKYTPDKSLFDTKKWAIAAGVLLAASGAQAGSDTGIKPATVTNDTAFKATTGPYTFLLKPASHYIINVKEDKQQTDTASNNTLLPTQTGKDCYMEKDPVCIYGYVTNEWHKPVASAKVVLMVMDIEFEAQADTTGFYKLFIPENISVGESEIGCISPNGSTGFIKKITAGKSQQVNLKVIEEQYILGNMRIQSHLPDWNEE